MQIKMVDLHRQYQTIKHDIDAAIQSVVESADFILGAAVSEFESHLARYLKVQYAIGCASGTDALQIALMALGIGRDDEVTIPGPRATVESGFESFLWLLVGVFYSVVRLSAHESNSGHSEEGSFVWCIGCKFPSRDG